MEFLEAIAEGMPTRGAAAIAQIPFETVRNWMSKNDPAFRPDFFRAFEKAKAVYYRKQIDKLNKSRDWRAAAFWQERHEDEFAPKNNAVSLLNQVAEGAVVKPKITVDEETMQALSEAYDRERARNKSSNIAVEKGD